MQGLCRPYTCPVHWESPSEGPPERRRSLAEICRSLTQLQNRGPLNPCWIPAPLPPPSHHLLPLPFGLLFQTSPGSINHIRPSSQGPAPTVLRTGTPPLPTGSSFSPCYPLLGMRGSLTKAGAEEKYVTVMGFSGCPRRKSIQAILAGGSVGESEAVLLFVVVVWFF